MLKRGPSLVEQAKLHLKQRISNAEFDEGRMPSEADLADELGVSRNTVRDALSRLEMEGVIYRKQGAGTFVNKANHLVKSRLEEVVPYTTLIHEHGYTPSIELIEVIEQQVEPKITHQLNLNTEVKMVVIKKLFQANNTPIVFTHSYIPVSLITQPYTSNDFMSPTYKFLPTFCQQTLAYFLTDIVPIIAPPWLIDQLALSSTTPTALIAFEEMGYNQKNQPILKATSYFRDDLLRLQLMRRIS